MKLTGKALGPSAATRRLVLGTSIELRGGHSFNSGHSVVSPDRTGAVDRSRAMLGHRARWNRTPPRFTRGAKSALRAPWEGPRGHGSARGLLNYGFNPVQPVVTPENVSPFVGFEDEERNSRCSGLVRFLRVGDKESFDGFVIAPLRPVNNAHVVA